MACNKIERIFILFFSIAVFLPVVGCGGGVEGASGNSNPNNGGGTVQTTGTTGTSGTSGTSGTASLATYTTNPTSGLTSLTVNFTTPASSTITSYSWDFGDGSSGSGSSASHTYTQAGTYTTSLTVTDSFGTVATESRNVYVFDSIDNAQVVIPSNVLFYDDFEYNVTRDGADPNANMAAIRSGGWSYAKAINITGSHNGYLYTATSIPGYSGPFPGRSSNSVMVIEGRSGSMGSQTDFYLEYGDENGSDETLPGNIWYQFWLYTNDYGDQRSRFSNRDKLIYPCRTFYPCTNLQYLTYAGSYANPPFWTDALGGPGAVERYLMIYQGNDPMVIPNSPDDSGKLGHNLNTYHLMANQWQLVKIHFDTSTPTGVYEAWIKPLGGEFIKVAEWISGQNGFTWNIANPGGHRSLRIPTTLPGANNNQLYDSWQYIDDFAFAASEDALPQYPY